MAERQITMARVMLSKRAVGGVADDVGEVLFSRIPVKSEDDYRCILEGILDPFSAPLDALQVRPGWWGLIMGREGVVG